MGTSNCLGTRNPALETVSHQECTRIRNPSSGDGVLRKRRHKSGLGQAKIPTLDHRPLVTKAKCESSWWPRGWAGNQESVEASGDACP